MKQGRRSACMFWPGSEAEIAGARPTLNQAFDGRLTCAQRVDGLLAWLDLPEEQVWAMGTCNPARLLGLNLKGTIRVGADADLVLWDQTAGGPRAARTWVRGRCVFQQ